MFTFRRICIASLALFVSLMIIARVVPFGGQSFHNAIAQVHERGSFGYDARIQTVVVPGASIDQAGRTPQRQDLAVRGQVDLRNQMLDLRIAKGSGNFETGVGVTKLQVINGVARSQLADGSWETIDLPTAMFGANSDVLGLLDVARSVGSPEQQQLAGETMTRYRFQIDGPAFARQISAQMERIMRQQGRLPAGSQLAIIDAYLGANGDGELLVDAAGLPRRQVIHLNLPDPQRNETVQGTITVDYRAFGPASSLALPLRWLADVAWGALALNLAVVCLVTFAVFALLASIRSRRLARALGVAIPAILIANLVFPIHPAAAASPAPVRAAAPPRGAVPSPVALSVARQLGAGDDSDRDGLTDGAEAVIGTDPTKNDTDGDGRSDGIEVLEVGTKPTQRDTDGDGLSDGLELDPITGPDGRIWRLNPLAADTNNDGQSDLIECIGDTFCPDTDGDMVPNAWDDDNDNDGVPDQIDAAPQTVVAGARNADGSLEGVPNRRIALSASNTTPGKTLLFDFTIRPTNPGRLWYSQSVLDWPADDREGQIRRVLTDTLGLSGRLADGDMRLVPTLEVKIPYLARSFGGLPVKAGYAGTDMPTLDGVDLAKPAAIAAWFDRWLDQEKLRSYQITVRLSGSDRSLLAYVPLDVQRNPIGDAPVAFTANMMFRPQQGTVPPHEVRLAWNVQSKTDSCSASPDADNAAGETFNQAWWNALPREQREREKYTKWAKLSGSARSERWCSGTRNWTSNAASIIHSYYDDFYMVALTAREDRGVEVATIAQHPDAGTAAFQPHLWNLARGLERAFVAGRDCDAPTSAACSGNGQLDITPAAIKARWDRASNAAVGQAERWNIPADALSVRTASFVDEGESAALFVSTQRGATQQSPLLLSFLNDTFVANDVARTALPTVIIARLHTTASLGLPNATIGSDGAVSFNMAEAPASTISSLSWKPFRYKGAGLWEQASLSDAWQQIGPALDTPLQAFGGAPAANTSALRGAKDLLLSFYLALNSGRGGMATFDGVIASRSSAANADEQLAAPASAEAVAGTIAESMVNSVLSAQQHRTLLVNADATSLLTALGNQQLTGDGGPAASLLLDMPHLPAQGNNGLYSKAFAALDQSLEVPEPSSVPATKTLISMQVAADGIDKVNTLYGAFDAVKAMVEAHQLINASTVARTGAETISKAMDAIATADKIGDAQAKIAGLVTDLNQVSAKIAKATDAIADASNFSPDVLGIVIEVVVFAAKLMALIASGDVTFFTITSLIVETAASVAVNVFMLGALAAIVPIGTVIAALIGLIDAVIGLACGFSERFKETLDSISEVLCEGISGNLTKYIAAIFWDTQPLVDMTAGDRITPTNWKMPPRRNDAGDSIGMVAGNTLDVSADVVTRLRLNSKFNYSTNLILESADKLPNSTVRYQFTTKEEQDNQKIHNRLGVQQGQMRSNWLVSGAGFAKQEVVTQTITTTLTLKDPQLNWHPDGFYLAEGYAVPSLYCALRFCSTYTKRDSNYMDLAPSFAFDVFPATLDGFMSLTDSDGDGGFRLAWDAKFPDLKDADGDGLLGRAAGGPDLSDNAPDSDRDGLSDAYELKHASLGLNPQRADTDSDGLSDLEEIRRDLDPAKTDSDNDGLSDGDEVAGWDIIFGYDANDAPLRFRVTSDPRDPDTDNDGLLDVREKIYGLNPRVLSSNEPLQIQSSLNEPDGVNDGIVAAGSSVGFSAVISSTLRDRFALGLFEADLESTASKPDIAPTAYRLGPLANSTLSGSLDLSAQTSTTTTNVATRAGAIIASVDQLSGGRVVWLPFEEATNTGGFADASPFGNNAICQANACPAVDNASYGGRGLIMTPGTSVSIAHSQTIAAPTWTLSLWVNPGAPSGVRPLIAKGGGSTQRTFALGLDSDNKISVAAESADCATNAVQQLSNQPLTSTGWSLVTLVANSPQLALFINGSSVGSWNTSAGLCANTAPITASGPAGGKLDEISLYPYPMTPVQVQGQFRDPVLTLAFNGTINDSSYLQQRTSGKGNGTPRIANSRGGDRVGVFDKRSWIDITSSPSLDMSQGTGQFTLAAYVRPVPLDANGDEWQAIMGKQDQFNTYPSLYVNKSGKLKAEFGNGSALCESGATTHSISDGVWSHVAVSYTGTQFVFSINGVEAERLALSGACSPGSRPTGSELFVGRSSPNAQFKVSKIHVINEGDGIGTAEYEGLWKGSRVWYQENIDVGDYSPNELSDLQLDSDNSFRFELKEIDTCDACHDIQVDAQLRNYQVNANGTWNYNDDGQGTVSWKLWNNWFNGDLDDVQIYRVALDSVGIRDLFNSLNNRSYALQTRLEEPPTSTLFRDGSGNLQTGFCSGSSCPTTGLPGRDGQAAAFDGNDSIVIADRPSLDLATGLTAAAWVKLDDVTSDQKIISKYDPTLGGYNLAVANGKLYGEVKDSSGARTEVLGGSLTPGVWTHLAISASPGQYLIGFVNGVEVARSPIGQIQGDIVAVGRPLGGNVTLYGDGGYESSGDNMVWNTNHDEPNFDQTIFTNDNNEASSVRIGRSCVRLYDNKNYGGASVPVCDDTAVLSEFNDRAESLRHYGTSPRFNAADGGLRLDRGQLQYLQIDPNRVGNPVFSTFSATAWVKVKSGFESHTIVARGGRGLPDGFSMRIGNQGEIVYQAGNSTFSSTDRISFDTWTHVAVTHDGTMVRFYINGAAAGNASFAGNIDDPGGPILVGRFGHCGSATYCDVLDGAIRGVALYTRGLSATEVNGLRNTPSGAAPDGRVMYLPLDADQGSDGDNAATFRTVQAPTFATNDLPLTIGRASWQNVMFVRGTIDEVSLLEYAADASEVAALAREAPQAQLALDDVLGSTSFANVAGSTATCGGTTSCPQAGARGRIREAAVFGSAANSGLELPDTTVALNTFSAELWVRPEAVRPGEQLLLAKADDSGANVNMLLSLSAGALTPRARVGTSELIAQRALNQGQWNHLVATFDGSTLRLYINGTAEAGTASATAVSSTAPVRVGFHPGIGVGFNGMLDAISLYGQALSPEAVAAHYQYQESWFDVVERHQLTIDGDNPTVAFGLANNVVVARQPLRVSIAASDPTSHVQGVFYDGDGDATAGPWLAAEPSGDGTNWLFNYTPAAGGSFPLRAYADDIFGHRSAVATVTVRVDDQVPTLTLNADLTASALRPAPGTGDDAGTWVLNLAGTIGDNLSSAPTVVAEILSTEGSLGNLTATGTGGTWRGVFRFNAPPNGQYTIKLHATDDMGNRVDADALVLALDATAPVADVAISGNEIGNPVAPAPGTNGAAAQVSTSTSTIQPPQFQGTLADLPSLADTTLLLHAEEPNGATRFLDSSVFQQVGSCAAIACPGAIVGQTGHGWTFDGSNDQIVFSSIIARPAGAAYAVSIWARPGAVERTLFSAADATGTSLEIRAASGAYTATARIGTAMRVVGGGVLTPNSWNHLALSFDGNQFASYSGGALVQQVDASGTVATFDRVWLGSNAGTASFYQGDADEVAIYSVPLTPKQVASLVSPVRSTVASALPRLRDLRNQGTATPPISLTATLTPTAGAMLWSAAVPQAIEGIYQLDIGTSDSLGNQRELTGVWRGAIDTKAPDAQLFFYRLADGRTVVRCEVSDFNLDPTQIGCPVPASAWNYTTLAETWYTGLFPNAPRRVRMSTSATIITGDVSNQLRVCDSFGNCTTVVGSANLVTGGLSTFTAPTPGQIVTAPGPIALGGMALAQAGLRTLQITSGSQQVLSKSFSDEIVDIWSTSVDLDDGIYQLQATVTDRNGAVYIDALAPRLMVDRHAPTLALPQNDMVGGPQLSSGKLVFTLGVTETVALSTVEARIGAGVWQQLDISQLVNNRGSVAAAIDVGGLGTLDGQRVELTLRATDQAGLSSTLTRLVVLDNTAPRVEVDRVALAATSSVVLFGTVREGGGTPDLRLILDRSGSQREYPLHLEASANGTWTWQLTLPYDAGLKTASFSVSAVDPAGNRSQSAFRQVTLSYRTFFPTIDG